MGVVAVAVGRLAGDERATVRSSRRGGRELRKCWRGAGGDASGSYDGTAGARAGWRSGVTTAGRLRARGDFLAAVQADGGLAGDLELIKILGFGQVR